MTLKEALERPELIREQKLEQRRALWERIQTESPDVAEFIMGVSKIFGKLSHVDYKLADKSE